MLFNLYAHKSSYKKKYIIIKSYYRITQQRNAKLNVLIVKLFSLRPLSENEIALNE